MNLEEFQTNILNLSNVDTFESANQYVLAAIEGNFVEYITNLFLLLDQGEIEAKGTAITLILSQTENGNILQQSDIMPNVIQYLYKVALPFWSNDLIQNQFKLILSTIIAKIGAYMYQNFQSLEMQKFVMEIWKENPFVEDYVIPVITGIITSCNDLGGFDSDQLLIILQFPSQLPGAFISRVQLFFAIAKQVQESELMINIFLLFFGNLTTENINDFLRALIDFSETNAQFYAPFFPILIEKLINFALESGDETTRNLSMMCFSAICKGAKSMCHKVPEFLQTIDCLIQIMSEITEDISPIFDPNAKAPCVTARLVLSELFYQAKSSTFCQHLFKLTQQVLEVGLPNWNVMYSIVAAYAELDVLSIFYLSEKKVKPEFKKFYYILVELLVDQNVHFHVRIVIYKALSVFASKLNIGNKILPTVLQCLFQETIPFIQIRCLKCLRHLFELKLCTRKKINLENELFLQIFQLTNDSTEELLPYFLQCLCQVTNYIGQDYYNYLPNMMESMETIFNNNSDVTIKVHAYVTFAKSLSQFKFNTPPNVKTFLLNFTMCALSLDSEQINDKVHDLLFSAIDLSMDILQIEILPVADLLFTNAFEIAETEIEIISSASYDQFDYLGSIYIQLNPNDSGLKYYIYKEQAMKVGRALEILLNITKILHKSKQKNKYIPQIQQLVLNILNSELIYEKNCEICWAILSILDFGNYVSVFLNTIEKYKDPYIIASIIKIITEKIHFLNPDIVLQVMDKIVYLYDYGSSLYTKELSEMKQWEDEDREKIEIFRIQNMLQSLNRLVKTSLKLWPETIFPYYTEKIEPKMYEYMENDILFVIGANMIKTQLSIFPNYDKARDLISRLMFICSQLIKCVTELCWKELGDIIVLYPSLPPEEVQQLYSFIEEFLNDDDDEKYNLEDIENINDAALVSYTKFMLIHFDEIDYEHSLTTFLFALPLCNPINDIYIFQLFAKYIMAKNNLLYHHLASFFTKLALSWRYNRSDNRDEKDKEKTEILNQSLGIFHGFITLLNNDNNGKLIIKAIIEDFDPKEYDDYKMLCNDIECECPAYNPEEEQEPDFL